MPTTKERRELEDRVLAPWLPLGVELPASDQERTLALNAWYRQSGAPAVVLSRARFAEDALFEAVSDGVRQYVVVGAGMDTFAFRMPELASSLRVFEVDHPATRATKRRRLASAGLEAPKELRFVPIDLEAEKLACALERCDFDAGLPSLFSWLGVTMYLTAEAIAETLGGIRVLSAPRSRVVFDYVDLDAFDPAKADPAVSRMIERTRSYGEPVISGFRPDQVASLLEGHGFRLVANLPPDDVVVVGGLVTLPGCKAVPLW
jgi:methyltransferase (TIGR00027 family)